MQREWWLPPPHNTAGRLDAGCQAVMSSADHLLYFSLLILPLFAEQVLVPLAIGI